MKIAANQSFNGLYLKNLREFDRQAIEPCMAGLKRLAKRAEITLKSSSAIQQHPTYQLVRPSIEISITPKETLRTNLAKITYSIIMNKDAIKNKRVLSVAKNLVNLQG